MRGRLLNARRLGPAAGLAVALGLAAPAWAEVTAVSVERIAADRVLVTWRASGPVDLYEAEHPGAEVGQSRLIAEQDRDGRYEVRVAATARPYFLLRDVRDGTTLRVAERLLPLERGSNFRDVGGYPAAGGKHVRWGMIFRSGATPLLSDSDLQQIKALGLAEMVDLRSREERSLAPTRIQGVKYVTVDYSMVQAAAANGATAHGTTPHSMAAAYKLFPNGLAEQVRLTFDALVSENSPIVFNCSAGQDRTGFVTAMILSALGTPRDVILQDFHLSTAYRRPQFEMPPIDPAAHPGNPIAQHFARAQSTPEAAKPAPLYAAEQPSKSLLEITFEEIDATYGSVDAYLQQKVGVTPAELAKLRALYLE
ncbi:tyrosine-protein phosphatase [Phenylobacterium sp. LjRoot219]|uniref:tyrosine-protein phosphatase n=1 Tax=Phenylobacterium sp. LjRoot219 TaxID=3342283 RepID=UPI003ECDD44F